MTRRYACRWPTRHELILAVSREASRQQESSSATVRTSPTTEEAMHNRASFPAQRRQPRLNAQSFLRLFGRNTSTEEMFPSTGIGGGADEEAVGNDGRRRVDDQLRRGVSPRTRGNTPARNHGPGHEFRGSIVRPACNPGPRAPGDAFRTDRPDTQHVEENGAGNGERGRPAGIARRSVRQFIFDARKVEGGWLVDVRRTLDKES